MKTFLRRVLYSLGGLLVLLVLFHLVENWRGRRAWGAWQQEQEASGHAFTRANFAPLPVPEAENFAAAPRIAAAATGTTPLLTLPANWPEGRLTGWQEGQRADLEPFRAAFPNGDIEKGLEAYRGPLEDIAKAARRPSSRLLIDYARFPDLDVPNLLGFRAAGRMLQLRALVALRDGRTEDAFQDVTTLLLIIHHFEKEPILLCQLLRLALTGIALRPIWEGMDTHAWSDAQLSALQGLLARENLLASLGKSWEVEQVAEGALYARTADESLWSWTPYPRAYALGASRPARAMAFLRHLAIPRGWILQNGVRAMRAIQVAAADPLRSAVGRIDPRRQDEALKALTEQGWNPYTFLASNLAPALAEQNIRAARYQAALDEVRIACELERYHRAHAAYPEQLTDLGKVLPNDVIGGEPLRYRRMQDGGYVLYSLGWNATDDGGSPGRGAHALREGDWVWTIRGQSRLS